jgi:hypothetical protein
MPPATHRPERVRAAGFTAFTKEGDFARVLEAELVDQVAGKSFSPKGGGKVGEATIPRLPPRRSTAAW